MQLAASAMGAFRACAQEESTLSTVAKRVEATLGRRSIPRATARSGPTRSPRLST
jgi:hypothetical protein